MTNQCDSKAFPEALYYAKRVSQGGGQPVFKRLLPDGTPTKLCPGPSQKLYNHSPFGFDWGSPAVRRARGEISEALTNGKFSYEFSGDFDNAIVGQWNFVEIEDVMVERADMDNIEGHLQSSSKSYLGWDISTEFNGGIHQYSFALKCSDKVNKELIAMSREINNISESLSRQVSISSQYFSKSTSLFTILNILKVASCSPHFPLKKEPIPMTPKVFILSPSIITSLATKGILVRAPCFAIDSIGQFFNNPFTAKEAFNTLWHIILLTFCLYYITSIPNKTSEGTSQLALALLLDATTDPELALNCYQTFKWDKVSGWGEEWSILRSAILLWVEEWKKTELEAMISQN